MTNFVESYQDCVRACRACPAREECRSPVPGEGNWQASIVFVGRNPGREEDRIGRPFVGPAGEVLSELLWEVEIERKDVFITNLVLCHTINDRYPSEQEIKTCVCQFLLPTLNYIAPKLVVGFGRVTNYWLAGIKNLSKSVGKLYKHKAGFWYMPSYHPASVYYSGLKEQFFEVLIPILKRFKQ